MSKVEVCHQPPVTQEGSAREHNPPTKSYSFKAYLFCKHILSNHLVLDALFTSTPSALTLHLSGEGPLPALSTASNMAGRYCVWVLLKIANNLCSNIVY